MTIHHIYCDSTAAGGGFGTKALPFNTLTAIGTVAAASGDTRYVHIKSGSNFSGERFPSTVGSVVGRDFWVDVYGGSTRPIINVSTPVASSTWVLNATYGFYTATLGTNVFPDVATRLTIGAVFEDGVPLTMQLYNGGDLAAMSAALTGGGYAEDWTTGVTYMRPRSSTPSSHTYSVATLAYGLTCTQSGTVEAPEFYALDHRGLRNPNSPDGRPWNFFVEGLRFIGGKWGGISFERGTGRVNDCEFYGNGGVQWQTYTIPHSGNSSHLGNAIGISNDARGILIENCLVEQTFDSGISPQTFNSGDVVSDVILRNNRIKSAGFYGIEILVAGTNATVRNVLAEHNHISKAQDCFGYSIHVGRFKGISVLDTGTTNFLDNIDIRHNTVEDMTDTWASGTGATAFISTEGTRINFSNNTARSIERNGFYLPVGTGLFPSDLTLRNNILDNCSAVAILLNGTVTSTQVDLIENQITNTPIAFKDTSSVNTPVKLNQNKLNGTDAVDASRTAGITGFGNTSTGVKTGYEYLF